MRVFPFLPALVLGVAPAALAQPGAWETIISKPGQFSVEMPAQPTLNQSRTRKGPGGVVKVLMLGSRTEGGSYLAYKIEFPTPIVKGTEEAQLDMERNEFAEEWNGKVISEKRVRAAGKVGRDFTIRGKPAEEIGVVTIRVRQYLVGNALYAVMVLSKSNRELPVDAGRFLGSLAIGAVPVRAAGTPEPEAVGRELADWGMAIDPDKDCEFRPMGKSLTITVPAAVHEINPDGGKLNSPRLMREVDGDFAISVKVSGEFQPGGKSTNPKTVPYNGGGIVIWSDSDNFIRLERAAMNRKGKIGTLVAFEEREGGYRGAVHSQVFAPGPCYLRVERHGSRMFGGISADGKSWKLLQPIDTSGRRN